MKKIIVLLCSLSLVFILSVPVSASSGWYVQTITSDDWSYKAYYDHPTYGAGWYHQVEGTLQESTNRITFSLPSNATGESSHPSTDMGFLFEANTGFSVSAGDVIQIDSFDLSWFIGGSDNYVSAVSIMFGTVLESYDPDNNSLYRIDNIVASTDWIYTNYTSGQAVQRITFPDTTLKVNEGGHVDVVWLSFYLNHPTRASFNVERVSFSFGFGNPNSPEAPGYIPPDNSSVDSYDDVESDLLGSVEDGKEVVTDIYTGFSVDPFLPGLAGWVALFGLVIPRLDWLQTLLTASLALGLFAFLFNVVAIVVKRRGNDV